MKALLSAAVLCATTLLAGCGGGGSGTNANANPITVTVTVTQNGVPVGSNIAVVLSTGISGNPSAPTGVLQTLNTNNGGVVTFQNLPGGTLCVSATINSTFYGHCQFPFPDTYTLGS
jgi:hypothetical protein